VAAWATHAAPTRAKRLVMALLDAGCLAETLIAFFQECLRF